MFYKFLTSLSISVIFLISCSTQAYSPIHIEDIRFMQPETTAEGKSYSAYRWPSLPNSRNNLETFSISEKTIQLIDNINECQQYYRNSKDELISLHVPLIIMKDNQKTHPVWIEKLEKVGYALFEDGHYLEIIEQENKNLILYKNTKDTSHSTNVFTADEDQEKQTFEIDIDDEGYFFQKEIKELSDTNKNKPKSKSNYELNEPTTTNPSLLSTENQVEEITIEKLSMDETDGVGPKTVLRKIKKLTNVIAGNENKSMSYGYLTMNPNLLDNLLREFVMPPAQMILTGFNMPLYLHHRTFVFEGTQSQLSKFFATWIKKEQHLVFTTTEEGSTYDQKPIYITIKLCSKDSQRNPEITIVNEVKRKISIATSNTILKSVTGLIVSASPNSGICSNLPEFFLELFGSIPQTRQTTIVNELTNPKSIKAIFKMAAAEASVLRKKQYLELGDCASTQVISEHEFMVTDIDCTTRIRIELSRYESAQKETSYQLKSETSTLSFRQLYEILKQILNLD